MLNRIFLLLAFAASLLAGGCKPDANTNRDANLEFVFNALYDGVNLRENFNYPYGTHTVQFRTFTLFISDIEVIQDGKASLLKDAIFLDFFPQNSTSDQAQTIKHSFDLPSSEYSAIRIGLGVKPAYNDRRPSDFPSGHALTNEMEYWLGWRSYIFTKIEGAGDSDQNGAMDYFTIYHVGGNPTYRTLTFPLDLKVQPGSNRVEVSFDLKKAFTLPDGSLYDMLNNPATHSQPDELTVANEVMDGLARATTISVK
ncbi:MAG: MbnP family protein [Saprospiraceae bacterium]